VTAWLSRIVPPVLLGLIALLVGAELWVIAHNPTIIPADVGSDYTLYMDATRRWVGGGAFYLPAQFAGQYTEAIRPILYPPQALVLFVPFTFLPAALWFGIPIILTGWIIAWHRPSIWGSVAMLAIVAAAPLLFLPYVAGTPTIWIVAFLALGTRWPAAAALVLLKPTLAPFALIGSRDGRFWAGCAVLATIGLAMLPMSLDWIRAVTNLTGEKAGVLYSVENLPLVAVVAIAWISGRHAPALRGARAFVRRARSGRTQVAEDSQATTR
jgi:hypothetical protein